MSKPTKERGQMTTDEIILELRKAFESQPLCGLLKAAADRLEELDERVAIMEEGCGVDTSFVGCGDTIKSEEKAFGDIYPIDMMEHRHSGLIEEE